jgi:hypothetical protein
MNATHAVALRVSGSRPLIGIECDEVVGTRLRWRGRRSWEIKRQVWVRCGIHIAQASSSISFRLGPIDMR